MSRVQPITSIKAPQVVEARALSSASGRRHLGKLLLQGEQTIKWALEAGLPIEQVFVHNKIEDHPLLTHLLGQEIDCFAVSDGILKKISETRYLVPFVGVTRPKRDTTPPRLGDFVIVLDGVQDHGNIGTIIRTARGFGIRDVVVTDQGFDPHYQKIIEASRGKVFDTRVTRFDSASQTVAYLKQRGFQIVATSPYAPQLQATVQLEDKPIALVVGNETHGVSDEVLQNADLVVQIPMSSTVESLNVGVATGISVYEFKLKLVIAMLAKYIRATLGREVNVAGQLIQRALDAALQPVSPFNSTQVILLMVLTCDQTMTLEQVSKDTATFGDDLQVLLQPLLDGGYVRYDEQAASATIRPTERGEQLIGQLWGIVESTEDRILEGFSDEERQHLTDYLKRIQSNCVRIVEQALQTKEPGQGHESRS